MDTVVRDPYREALTAATGRDLDAIAHARVPGAYHQLEVGAIDEDAYWAHYVAAGVPIDVARFHEVRRAGYAFVTGMDRLLDDLDGLVLRVAATNYPRWVDELLGGMLVGRFEAAVASIDIRARKPDPVFYARVAAAAGVEPAEVLVVDDRQVNVDGALAVGMRAHLFAGAEDLRARLRAEAVPV